MSDDFELPEQNDEIAAEEADPLMEKTGSMTDWKKPGKAQDTKGKKGKATEDKPKQKATEDDPTLKASQVKSNKMPEYSQDELLAVFDELMFKGEYREEFSIRNRLPVTFRSRTAKEVASISRRVDKFQFHLMPTIQQHYGLLNLAYSTVAYDDTDLSDRDPIPDRYQFLADLPSPVIDHLITKLNEFDYKVFKACEEGKENF